MGSAATGVTLETAVTPTLPSTHQPPQHAPALLACRLHEKLRAAWNRSCPQICETRGIAITGGLIRRWPSAPNGSAGQEGHTVCKRWMAWRHFPGAARYRSATGSRIECCRWRSGASSACLPEVRMRPCVVATRLLIQPPADECEAVITRLKHPHHAIRSIIPSVGDEGSPLYSFFGMRRAR